MGTHYLVFIHGIGERDPKQADKNLINHSYEQLWKNIVVNFKKLNSEFAPTLKPIYTDWHTAEIHQAESKIFTTAFPGLLNRRFSIMRLLRSFFTFFIGDVIAYVSEDVNFIRRTVWMQMWAELEKPLKEEGATYSIISHSLGTVIAFDYLFTLFKRQAVFIPELNPIDRPEDRQLPPAPQPTAAEIELLQTRFRHFITFGSPIGLFMLRKGSLWMDQEPFKTLYNPIRGDQQSWCNFYDTRDVIAYPLEPLFGGNPENHGCQLEDIEVKAGWLTLDFHSDYWNNQRVAEKIARIVQIQ